MLWFITNRVLPKTYSCFAIFKSNTSRRWRFTQKLSLLWPFFGKWLTENNHDSNNQHSHEWYFVYPFLSHTESAFNVKVGATDKRQDWKRSRIVVVKRGRRVNLFMCHKSYRPILRYPKVRAWGWVTDPLIPAKIGLYVRIPGKFVTHNKVYFVMKWRYVLVLCMNMAFLSSIQRKRERVKSKGVYFL